MGGCCDDSCAVDALQQRQRGTLHVVLVVNAAMFVVIEQISLLIFNNVVVTFKEKADDLLQPIRQ